MKNFLLASLLLSPFAVANAEFNQIFRCPNGEVFQLRAASKQSMLFESTLFQPQPSVNRRTLPQVESASGAKYSDGSYTVWIKGQQAQLLAGDTVLASDCSALPDDEPLLPIRDSHGGIVFIPPDRWLAGEVKLIRSSGASIKLYGQNASEQIEYHLQGANGSSAPLLKLFTFPAPPLITPSATLPDSTLLLGNDGQRIYLAQIAQNNPFDQGSAAGKQFAKLQTSELELRRGFTLYGLIVNQAAQTLSINIIRPKQAIRAGAELTIELNDLDDPGMNGQTLVKQSQILPAGQPKAAKLRFDPASINPAHRLTVSAKIRQGNQVIMSSEAVPVLTQGAGREVTLTLIPRVLPSKQQGI
ncbi:YbaY family lipoprotein [Chitinibacter sp. S2-10]|uniref:YbaY family lipoprotein n=1 Tax=Chitinibacter sp. S2-10 TaxID=3373597 RepID=UPI003977484B